MKHAVIEYNHHGDKMIFFDGRLLAKSADFSRRLETWYLLTSCIERFPVLKHEYTGYCEQCGDCDEMSVVDIPEHELRKLISMHRRLDEHWSKIISRAQG